MLFDRGGIVRFLANRYRRFVLLVVMLLATTEVALLCVLVSFALLLVVMGVLHTIGDTDTVENGDRGGRGEVDCELCIEEQAEEDVSRSGEVDTTSSSSLVGWSISSLLSVLTPVLEVVAGLLLDSLYIEKDF